MTRKITFRLVALLLLAVLSVSAASCKQDFEEETPEGMMIACCAGADYRLYVPTTWVGNTAYGVSGAYRVLGTQSTVSVNRYPITEALHAEMTAGIAAAGADAQDTATRLQWFYTNYCEAPVRARALDQKIDSVPEECVATTLDGVNAWQFRYSALVNGERLQILQVIAEKADVFYVFSFTATTEMYEMFHADVTKMLQVFVFADPYTPPDFAKQLDDGKDAPAGMKAAFGDDVAYCFYVPDSWELRMDESIYAAYVPSDKTSVSVVPYQPAAEEMRVSEYFAMSRDLMQNTAGVSGFEMLADGVEKIDLGGRQATVYEFRLTLGGITYRYRQYVAAYRGMIYCVTYTATDSTFDAHLQELDQILVAFRFR